MQGIPSFDVLTDLMQRVVLDFVFHNFNQFDFMEVCRWLALVHDEREECILACVSQPPVSYVGDLFALLIQHPLSNTLQY